MEAEREAERRRLEAQKVLETDRLQAELDRELQAERRKLQEETEDQRAAMKKVLWTFSAASKQTSNPLKPRRVNGVGPGGAPGRGGTPTDVVIKRGVSVQADGLQEAPDELQREEMLRLEHQREMNSLREKHRDQVGATERATGSRPADLSH